MSNLNEAIAGDRNWLERLGQHIPGFRGYHDRESRREADQLLRNFGVSRLERIISDLHEATKSAPLTEMDAYGELTNDVEKLRNELRHSDRGYAGLFDEVKWDDSARLDAVYEQDAALVEALVSLAEQVHQNDFTPSDLKGQLRVLARAHSDRRNAILAFAEEN